MVDRVFVLDAGVHYIADLINRNNGRRFLTIPSNCTDPLIELSALLGGQERLTELHIFCHGDPGRIDLGGQSIEFASIGSLAAAHALNRVGAALREDGVIHLWACEAALERWGGNSFVGSSVSPGAGSRRRRAGSASDDRSASTSVRCGRFRSRTLMRGSGRTRWP